MCQLSPCSSRACLGKYSIFRIKRLQKTFPHLKPRKLPAAAEARVAVDVSAICAVGDAVTQRVNLAEIQAVLADAEHEWVT